MLAAVCLNSSGCIAALYNYDVEIESAEAVSEITAQTSEAEAASTDGSETPDAVYQAKLDSLPRDDRAGRKEVFNEWVKANIRDRMRYTLRQRMKMVVLRLEILECIRLL